MRSLAVHYDDHDRAVVTGLNTYGCDCCSHEIELTVENLQKAINYHKEMAEEFSAALDEFKKTGKVTPPDGY